MFFMVSDVEIAGMLPVASLLLLLILRGCFVPRNDPPF